MRCSLFAVVALLTACAVPPQDAAVERHVGRAGLAVEVVRLEHADAGEVVAVLRQLDASKADGRRSGTCALYPPGRRSERGWATGSIEVDVATNSIVLHGEPEDLRAMRELVVVLDQRSQGR